VSGLLGRPAFRGVSMEVWSQWKPGLLSVFLALLSTGMVQGGGAIGDNLRTQNLGN
jgi:hypothetical protein